MNKFVNLLIVKSSIENKIRLNAVLVCVIAALICGGMIIYLYSLNSTISGQKENIEKSNQILSLTDSLVSTVQQSQLASNRYLFTNNQRYLNQFRGLIGLIEEQIDSLIFLSGEASQIEKLRELGSLMKQKEQTISKLAKNFSRNAPFDTIKVQLQEIEPIVANDTLIVTTKRQDTVITLLSQREKKGSIFKRIGEAFKPRKINDTLNISTITTVDTVLNTSEVVEERQKVISQVMELSEEASQRYTRRIQRMEEQVSQLIISDQEISMQFLDVLLKLHRETLNSTQNEIWKSEALIKKNYKLSIIISVVSLGLILLFIILIINDVNKGHRARLALAEEKKKTEDLMRSRHELLLSVSHDIKAPLSSIMGYLDLFTSRANLSEKEKDAVDSMQHSGKQIFSLLTNLLEFSRLEQGKLELKKSNIDVMELCDEVRKMFRPLALQKQLEFKYANNLKVLRYISSDELKLKQIIVNILSNAIKYTIEGEVCFNVSEKEHGLVFEITDTGVGIKKSKMGNLFKPFVRVDDNKDMAEGSGFGMYVVNGLVELLQGDIRIRSEVGKGTQVTVTIPVEVVTELEVRKKNPIQRMDLSEKKYRLLIIDDDSVFLSMIKGKLQASGHLVTTYNTVVDFDKHIEELENYDAVLTDMEMGIITGKDILDKVKNKNSFIPVFVMTAHAEINKLKDFGFDGCIQKPFPIDKLIQMIEDKLNQEEKTIADKFPLLNEMFAGDEDAIKSILKIFIKSTKENIEMLKQYITDNNFQSAQSICHKMLPMFAQLELIKYVAVLGKMDACRGKEQDIYPQWKEDLLLTIKDIEEFIIELSKEIV